MSDPCDISSTSCDSAIWEDESEDSGSEIDQDSECSVDEEEAAIAENIGREEEVTTEVEDSVPTYTVLSRANDVLARSSGGFTIHPYHGVTNRDSCIWT